MIDEGLMEQYLTTVGKSVQGIIVDLDTELIVWVDPNLETLFGYIEGELVGKSIHEMVPEIARTNHEMHFRKYAQAPTRRAMGATGMRLNGRKRDGSTLPVIISLYPRMIRIPGGGPSFRACIATIMELAESHKSGPILHDPSQGDDDHDEAG